MLPVDSVVHYESAIFSNCNRNAFFLQPLMARLQNALTKQLTDEHERVDLKLREAEESVRKIRQSREETGVQLYGVQH